ncbi:MAG TPA: hypothetical protein VLA00_00790 [Xanthobacteraceae bacterium]|nr:hypothetical protein [Xanthobacteraceae bacterium]
MTLQAVRRVILLVSFVLALPAAAMAGPCAQAIDQAQKQVDRFIETVARTGPTAPEGSTALLSQQPSPSTLATEEEALGEGKRPERALKALARARAADAAGDAPGCTKALEQVQAAIGS